MTSKQNKPLTNQSFSRLFRGPFPKWFHIWFAVSCLAVFASGLVDEYQGNATKYFNAWGVSLSVLVTYAGVLVVCRNQKELTRLVSSIPVSALFKTIFLGWFVAILAEIASFPFNPLYPQATLLEDLAFTTPAYIVTHFFWYWALRHLRLSVFEAFFCGGLALGLIEIAFGGGGILERLLLTLPLLPFVLMIHGCHMMMPALLIPVLHHDHAHDLSYKKYFFAILTAFVGVCLGIGASAVLFESIF